MQGNRASKRMLCRSKTKQTCYHYTRMGWDLGTHTIPHSKSRERAVTEFVLTSQSCPPSNGSKMEKWRTAWLRDVVCVPWGIRRQQPVPRAKHSNVSELENTQVLLLPAWHLFCQATHFPKVWGAAGVLGAHSFSILAKAPCYLLLTGWSPECTPESLPACVLSFKTSQSDLHQSQTLVCVVYMYSEPRNSNLW